MIADGKYKICHIGCFEFPGVDRIVPGNIVCCQITAVNYEYHPVATFGVSYTVDIFLLQYFFLIFQISGGPYDIIVRNSNGHFKMTEIIVEFLGTDIWIIVPAVNIIVYGDPREKISNKKS